MEVKSELAGIVLRLEVSDGCLVAAGDIIVTIESMKMEILVEAPRPGICKFAVVQGKAIIEGDLIAVIS